jgi:hypothetical protein
MAVLEIVRFCETCKHWTSELSKFGNPNDPERLGFCERTRFNGDYADDRTSKAWAFSSEGGDAVLSTMRDFGCIQHESKDET